jgi:membrane fusion protein, heavy metal efflux system
MQKSVEFHAPAAPPVVPPRPANGTVPWAETPAPSGTARVPPGRLARLRPVAGTVVVVGLLAGFLVFVLDLPVLSARPPEQTVPLPPPPAVELVPGAGPTVRVPADVRQALGIRKGQTDRVAVATAPERGRPLVLPGSTALDPTRLMRVRARFAPAEVMAIGQVADDSASTRAGRTVFRELRSGDRVVKGDLLGVFYSVDVGSKKNDLIDALVQLKLDQEILERCEKASLSGALPVISLLTARRNVEADNNAIARALNTLKTWNIPEADIRVVLSEAEAVSKRGGKRDQSKNDQWARVELRAPDDGVVVERNVALHETVVDNTVNLFQIARVDRLTVLANAPEDDLPVLLRLPTAARRWTVRTTGAPREAGLEGVIDDISYLIDVNQHAAVVKGHLDNPEGRLRAGQFVTATIDLPPPAGVVEIPTAAVVDDGNHCYVFVQPDADKPEYTLRRVQVTQRFDRTVYVRSRLTPAETTLTAQEKEQGLLPKQPLRPGEHVLAAGVLELKKEVDDRRSRAREQP